MYRRFVLGLSLCLLACGDDDSNPGAPSPPQPGTVVLTDAFAGLTFDVPVDLQSAADGSNRLFVVEQSGRIRAFDTTSLGAPQSFLDLSSRVLYQAGSEMGLLGFAFHPRFPEDDRFFVYYTVDAGGRKGRLSSFAVTGDGSQADPFSEVVLLEVEQPFTNHNGGGLVFDGQGKLCLGLGDGGSAGDPQGQAQNRRTLLGSIVRIDVDVTGGGPGYEIPINNPYRGNIEGWREEIWAYGLRNPWRLSYDVQSNTLWAGDVGQGLWEEVDVIVAGGNYGWDCREGAHRYEGPPDGPSAACAGLGDFIDPVHEYPHADGNSSITGGHVYRGQALDWLVGHYLFGDFSSGRIWAFDPQQPTADAELLVDAPFLLSAFGRDASGEIYALQYGGSGRLWRLDRQEDAP